MAKPAIGAKRTCQGCGVRFYDLGRAPIICPKCGVEQVPDTASRSRRSRPAPAPEKPPAAVEPKSAKDAVLAENDDALDLDNDDEEKEDLIEDASELGEDDDDVAEVVTSVDKDDDDR